MSSRIEQIIGEIEEYVDSCKFQPLSTTKIVVNKEEIEELLRELRLKTPDEIKRYQKIINNKDAILEDAQTKADALIADAQARAQELVTQHEIMQKAYAQANDTINAANKQAQEILDSATQDANSIRLSAITYTDDMMANIGSVLNTTLEDAGVKYKTFIDSLQSCLDVVNHNRQELAPQTAQAAAITGSYHDNDGAKDDDDDLCPFLTYLERAYVFNPEDYLGTWRSKNGRVKIKIKKLSQKSVTFTYSQTNKKKTVTCKAKVKKSVAGNATRFSFTDSLGNVAKGYLTFDNGRLYVNIKTKTKAEGAKVHPSVDTVMIKE